MDDPKPDSAPQWWHAARRLRKLSTVLVAALCWILVGFALSDPELSPRAFLGGAKALFVVLAVLMTLWAGYRINRDRQRDD